MEDHPENEVASREIDMKRLLILAGSALLAGAPVAQAQVSVRAPFIIGGVIVGITGLVTLVKFGRVGFTVARAEIGDRAAII